MGEGLPRVWGSKWGWKVIQMMERAPSLVEEAVLWFDAEVQGC
jgi:hypothetical protein